MTELKWTRDSTFHDGGRNFRARGPGVYDVPEEAVEEYLDHRSGAWEHVDEDDTDTEQSANDAGSESSNDSADDGDTETTSEPEGEGGTLPFNPEEHTNAEIEERIAGIDDVETVRALKNLEEEQKDRSGATDAFDDRLTELEE
ncbi:hypothetical protein [Halobacterium salinarum]|uniref:hypothetical protein n=1 Tax=Halobacterium salinarum TaxID=2242 RepID=UPI00255359F1|nr:hypothetical protein [Halobacterium salinarum]MDL0127074.1 hypothetical protein [Halobacterium salinarum]